MRTITVLFVLWALFCGTKSANVCSKQRCDFLKALLPFFIILHHHAQRTDWPWPFDGDFWVLGAPIVMIFFFISGYGLEYKRSSKGLRLQDLPARLKKLFTPTLAPILMYYIGILSLTDSNILDYLRSCLTCQWYPLPYSWFVVILAILYVGFYLCASMAKSGRYFLVLLFFYSVATVVALKLLHAPGWMIRSDFAVFVGAAYKRYEERIMDILELRHVKPFIAIFTVAFVMTYLYFSGDMPKLLKLTCYVWLGLIFAMFTYVRTFKSRTIDFLTRISYDVYLCQGIAFGIVPYKDMNFALSFIFIVLLTVAIATFSHWAHKRVFG